jgi:serine/threonine protein kinase
MAIQTLQPGIEPYPGYCLRRLLGQGGFGEVWETEVADGTRVALKFIPCGDSMETAREFRAFQALRQLQHPNLIRIERLWSQMGYIVLAMELAEGTLADLLEVSLSEFNAPLEAPDVCGYLAQVAEALDFLNARQHEVDGKVVAIQHCDVKPRNMLIFGDTIKLADFGLATPTASRLQLRRPAGTYDYAAPEVFGGQLCDQSDQYSLAVSYCELRSGKLPFPKVLEFRQSWPLNRPPADLSMLAPKEQPIIAQALSRGPSNRWPSCRDLMARLSRAVS